MKQLFGSPLALAALLSLLPACEQPKADCTVGIGAYAAKYTLKPGSKVGEGACDTLKGDTIGLVKYSPLEEGEKTRQDFTKALLALRTAKLGGLAVDGEARSIKDDNRQLDSIGDFVSTTPDDDDVCSVPKLTAATQKLPEFTPTPLGTCGFDKREIPIRANPYPATDIKHEWSNIRLYVTAAYPGTQMVGEFTYTDGGCSASYDVIGLWPAVSCRTQVTATIINDMGKEETKPACDADGNLITKLDPALCDPVADPTHGRPTGSGINPDLKKRVTCDPDLGLCVLGAPPDALNVKR